MRGIINFTPNNKEKQNKEHNKNIIITNHIKEMLEQRGYNIQNTEENTIFGFENGPYFKKQEYSEKEAIKIYIAKYMAKELGIKNFNLTQNEAKKIIEEILKNIVAKMQPKIKIIIILPQELFKHFTPEKALSLQTISEKMQNAILHKITIFSEDDFKINPTKSEYVPKHELATEKDIKELQSKKITTENLPIILLKDTISKWYGFQKGDIIKITRDYVQNEEEKIYFRHVHIHKPT